jgi:hypothetical protein
VIIVSRYFIHVRTYVAQCVDQTAVQHLAIATGNTGARVGPVVEALHCKPEGRGVDSR